ncbi:hypothetical protein MIZ03_4712 [Rhodoferax lithotrophicus]|uniref:Plasmid maintenance system killer protein n=1 Tax=Rhodoferax lithotrophicus TaxID=2798804 RepID=A0ABN6DDE5_9BURK|nr:hypothetical protein [Rhodoferax sp. MIZ03]BCO29788.1 hypothetical protein MIZ03_4712 [Rhodoferax sp. MIZ03]
MLEISFANKSLRTLCENSAKAEAAFGIEAAVRLQRRLADLRAANNINELVDGSYTKDTEGIGNKIIFNLSVDIKMIIIPNHMVIPTLRTGKTDWKKVRRIKVIEIQSHKR